MLRLRKLKVLMALVLALALLVGPSLSVYGQNAEQSKVYDNELVISTLDDNGNIEAIKVLDHLRLFGNGPTDIQDVSKFQLVSARNLYSTNKVQLKDGNLGLKTNISGKGYSDLYYLAELNKQELTKADFPVSVKLEYYLDGKKVPASEMAGKDGHIKIVCYLENLTGQSRTLEFKDSKGQSVKKQTTVYTPYVVSLSGWAFDNKKFSNIKAPGVSQKSPQGVITDVQGITSVTWSAPLIPPKYPAKQYTVLEADGTNIELNSFNIAVIPILPTTSETDSLGSVQDSLNKLYGAFDSIQTGVGTPSKDATLLFGLKSIKDGVAQISSGMGSLVDKLKQIRSGLANPAFNTSTYDTATGADANGNKPGVKDAINICQSNIDDKVIPALGFQKTALDSAKSAIGTSADSGQVPSDTTSVYNDVNYLKTLVAGTPSEKIITGSIAPKLNNIGSSINGVSATNTLLEDGMKKISAGLGKANSGLGLMVLGLGPVDKNGHPVKVIIDGKPGSILYALAYMQSGIDGKLVPGITKIQEGTGKIGDGSGQAKEAIAGGLQTMEAVPALMSSMNESVAQADSFLGKPEGALGTVTYIYQTPEVNAAAAAMNYGLGAIVLALIILLIAGRPPKQIIPVPAEENQNV